MITGRSLLVRQFSRRAVAEALLHLGPISRAELAKETGLSKQTMSEVMAALESEGWARPAGRTSGAVGRSALRYEVARDAAFSLGVDLGGTKVIAALADLAVQKLGPIGAEMRRLMADPGHIDQILANGALRADAIARPILDGVKDVVGFIRRN